MRKKLNGRGRPPETRRDGNAVARAARRERLRTSQRGGLPVRPRLRLGPGSSRLGEASLVEPPFALPDAPINSRLPCGGGTSRVRELRGAAAPPRCPRVCKLGGGRRSRGLTAEAGPGREVRASLGASHVDPQHRHATCTALCTPAFPAASPPVRLTLARLSCTSQPLGGLEEGRLPVGGGSVGRIGFAKYCWKRKGCVAGQQSCHVVKRRGAEVRKGKAGKDAGGDPPTS